MHEVQLMNLSILKTESKHLKNWQRNFTDLVNRRKRTLLFWTSVSSMNLGTWLRPLYTFEITCNSTINCLFTEYSWRSPNLTEWIHSFNKHDTKLLDNSLSGQKWKEQNGNPDLFTLPDEGCICRATEPSSPACFPVSLQGFLHCLNNIIGSTVGIINVLLDFSLHSCSRCESQTSWVEGYGANPTRRHF